MRGDKQDLFGGLQKYRTLKSGLERLNQKTERLAHQILGLELNLQTLGDARQGILFMIQQFKDVVSLLQDPFNHTELEDSNVKILTMIYLMLQNLYVGHGAAEKLIDDQDSTKDPQALKDALIRGLKIMIAKLETKTSERNLDLA